MRNKIPKDQIYLIHNAIEQYWFDRPGNPEVKNEASLVYLGRIGNDDFTVKLKGLLHLIYVFKKFPGQNKVIIGMCHNAHEYATFFRGIPHTETFLNVPKENIPEILQKHYGDIYINASQYE